MQGKTQRTWITGLSLVVTSLLPAIVHACPMCFSGQDSNTDAFLYGSLFLMGMPVSALGGLGYWAYRRIKAADSTPVTDESQPDAAQHGVVLPIVQRR